MQARATLRHGLSPASFGPGAPQKAMRRLPIRLRSPTGEEAKSVARVFWEQINLPNLSNTIGRARELRIPG
jgi:hypothetical protein